MNKKASFVKGVLIFGFILGLQLDILAANYVVKSSADGTDDVHTLRGAIAAAASNRAKNDTIILVRDSYQVTAQAFLGDELAVTGGNLTIVGNGHSRVTINAAGLTHIFHVFPGAQLTLKNLTLMGSGDSYTNGFPSGGILNEGMLKLINCDIQGNRSTNGAGIYNSGSLIMHTSVIANNSCFSKIGVDGSGGGIYNVGILMADSCVISNNLSAVSAGMPFVFGGTPINTGGNGGGIYNVGIVVLNNCDVVNNSAGNGSDGPSNDYTPGGPFYSFAYDGGTGGSGGGIYNAGSLTLKRSIIGGNSCGNGGSGSDSPPPIITIGGDANGGNGGAGGSGGGIFNADGSSVTSYNCLFALNQFGIGGSGGAGFPVTTGYNTAGTDGNAGADGLGSDLFGDFTSIGHNLVREGDDSTGFTNGVRHDVVGTIAAPADPLLYKFKK